MRVRHEAWAGILAGAAMGVAVVLSSFSPGRVVAAEPGGFADALVFDATTKEMKGKGGETSFAFHFAFTNTSLVPVVIDAVRTSCGCTTAKVPPLPWTIATNGAGEFEVVLDVRGKYGTITKSVFVNSTAGLKPLTVKVTMPDAPSQGGASGLLADDRVRNLQIALADRFAIFRGDCASCHATPAAGKTGPSLYLSTCGICHDSHNRASMVPDLKTLKHPTDREHWVRWITFGRHGSLMPAFAKSEGGPLDEDQIDSLADYLNRTISQPASALRQARALRPQIQRPIPPPLPGVAVPAPVVINPAPRSAASNGRSE